MTDSDNKMKEFEKQIAKLNEIVASMEQGGLSLQQSLDQFEQGIGLIKHCQQALETAEQKIKILTENKQLTEYHDDSN